MTRFGVRKLVAALLAVWAACLLASPAAAASCNYASSQGSTGPSDWQTYCWLDFSSYNSGQATSGNGQNFTFTLPDGTQMTFNLKVSSAGSVVSAATPSWSGAAVGNTAFLGIGGKPILYQSADGATTTITISNIVLTPPSSGSITNYMFVAGDGESTNDGETLRFQTNGGNWQMLDQVGPTSGSTYPTISGVGTSSFLETGKAGTVGAYIVGSTAPTSVTTTMVGSGLEGAMFAVRFASIRLTTQIAHTRIDSADQFTFSIKSTSGGSTLASGTSSGTGLGPFTAAALSSSAALPLTLTQTTAGGSASAIAEYQSSLSCTNSTTGSSTPLPTNVVTTSYPFGALQFGDAVQCTFTETAYPHLQLTKALTRVNTGTRRNPNYQYRQFANDQFVMNISQGSTVVATTTTTGSDPNVNNASTPMTQVSAGTAYTLSELGAGVTSLGQYTSTMSCTNAWASSSTTLPTTPGGSVTPQLGDIISCTITNTLIGDNGTLSVTKVSMPISDPVNGTINPMMLPGGIVQYTIFVQNSGNQSITSNSIFILDAVPSQIAVGSSSSPTFVQGSPTSGLTGITVKYSTASTPPTSWNGCTSYTPSAYDPLVRYICIRANGTMAASGGTPPAFSVTFLAKVK